jgi:hypothetical protein
MVKRTKDRKTNNGQKKKKTERQIMVKRKKTEKHTMVTGNRKVKTGQLELH